MRMTNSSEEIHIDIEDITELLTNADPSGTNQLKSDCPYCNKKGHFYINRTNYFWDCKKCKESGGIRKLLSHFNVLDQYLHKTLRLDKLTLLAEHIPEIEEMLISSLPKKNPPRGYKRTYDNPYLKERGLTTNDFYKYNIGTSTTSTKLQDYVIMLIEENGECKGYVSRCTLPKSEILELGLLRYRNSSGTKFNSLLFGYDEIGRGTKTVIIVEGVFDKMRLDNILETHKSQELKVVCTFGNKVSENQMNKLRITGVEKIILFYDLDAVEEMKRNAPKLKKHFELKIACLVDGKDPGDAPVDEVIEALCNEYEPNVFFYEKCNGRKIKT